jgi:hypothetical protein
MIVKNISAIQYFLERFDLIDYPKEYVVDYHPRAPQKIFFTNPTFAGEFHDCIIHSLPLLITNEDNLLTSHIWPLLDKVKNKPEKTHNLWKKWGDKIDINLPAVSKNFNENYRYVWLPVDEQSANNAWHIWIDVVSKFRLLEKKFSFKYTEFVYILSSPSKYFDHLAKELFPELKYYVMPKDTTWRFSHLIVPSMSNHNDGITVPDMPKWLRYKFGQSVSTPQDKIFISRKDAPARQLTNAEELFMKLKGWQTIILEDMPIKKQIETFSNAKQIISTHGAGLVNILWCQPGTQVIEITQEELLSKKPYPILSYHLDLKHHFVLGEKVPIKDSKNKMPGVKRLKDFNNLKIDITTLNNILQQ